MFPTRFSLYKKGSTYQILYYVHGVRRWVFDVQKLLEHVSISTTMIHAHLAADELHNAGEMVDMNLLDPVNRVGICRRRQSANVAKAHERMQRRTADQEGTASITSYHSNG